MRFMHHGLQQGGGVVIDGVVALEQLLAGEHDLVRGLAPAAAPAHAVRDHAQYAAMDARVGKQQDLVLLIGSVATVDAGRREKAKRGRHGTMRPAGGDYSVATVYAQTLSRPAA
ncbi:hypothetical protein D3C78_1571880 [compost metagenome]